MKNNEAFQTIAELLKNSIGFFLFIFKNRDTKSFITLHIFNSVFLITRQF